MKTPTKTTASTAPVSTWRMRAVLCLAIGGIVSACGQQGAGNPPAAAYAPQQAEAPVAAAVATEEAKDTAQPAVRPGQMQSSVGLSNDANRQFAITANVQAQVADVYAAVLAIEEAVQEQGGFVISNSIEFHPWGQRSVASVGQQQLKVMEFYKPTANLTVRVPTAQTQTFLRSIAKHLEFLHHRQIEAQDVQLALLRERLNILRNQQLQRNLDDAAARPGTKASQALGAIQAKDQAQHAQDEALLAQKELQDQVEFSTIELVLHQNPIVRTSTEPDTAAILQEARPGMARQLREALAAGWEMLMAILIALTHIWPLLLAAAAAATGWAVYKKKRAARATTPVQQAAHTPAQPSDASDSR